MFTLPEMIISSNESAALLANELKDIQQTPIEGITIYADKCMTFTWLVGIRGPEGSAYEGEEYLAKVRFHVHYPQEAPLLKFITKIRHPNVFYKSGNLFMNPDLAEDSDDMIEEVPLCHPQNVRDFLLSVLSLLSKPKTSLKCIADKNAVISYRKWRDDAGMGPDSDAEDFSQETLSQVLPGLGLKELAEVMRLRREEERMNKEMVALTMAEKCAKLRRSNEVLSVIHFMTVVKAYDKMERMTKMPKRVRESRSRRRRYTYIIDSDHRLRKTLAERFTIPRSRKRVVKMMLTIYSKARRYINRVTEKEMFLMLFHPEMRMKPEV